MAEDIKDKDLLNINELIIKAQLEITTLRKERGIILGRSPRSSEDKYLADVKVIKKKYAQKIANICSGLI